MRRGGLALILVVGVLAVLAVLGSAFVVLSKLERKAAAQRATATRAHLLARSGVEDALARLSCGQSPAEAWNRYRGEDWDDDGAVSGLEVEAEAFQPGVWNLLDCPVRHAMAPSFFRRHPTDVDVWNRPAPDRVRIDGRERGWSGRLDGQTYALNVEDESGKIHVNGGFLDAQDRDRVDVSGGAIVGDGVPDYRDPEVRIRSKTVDFIYFQTRFFLTTGWNDQLVRVLNILGAQPEVNIPDLGTLAIQNRPMGGYPSLADLQNAVGYPDRDLSPWLTVDGWTDLSVMHPNGIPQTPDFVNEWGSMNAVKMHRMPFLPEAGGRPPVNLNTASRPVLVALLQDLRGMSWYDMAENMSANITYFEIPADMAGAIADALIDFRNGRDSSGAYALAGIRPETFRTWSQFCAFCDALVPGTIYGLNLNGPTWQAPEPDYDYVRMTTWAGNLCGADLLKANFDPNSMLAKQLPDPLMFRFIDKSDLQTWSTEGCFRSSGRFRISSAGRVVGADARLLAESTLSERAELHSLLRQTTQKDFVGGRSLALDTGAEPRYLSLASPAPPFPALPQRTTGAGASWNVWGTSQGLGAVTYPCPPTALPGKAAEFDGYIGLATVELDPAWLPPSAPPLSRLTFLHHFDDAWNAEFPAGPSAVLKAGGWSARLQLNLAESVWPDPAVQPNSLCPDGAHVQQMRIPAYAAAGNFPADATGDRGVMSYWAKSESNILSHVHASCWRMASGAEPAGYNQLLMIGHRQDHWGMVMESRVTMPMRSPTDYEAGFERQDWTLYRPFNAIAPSDFLKPGMRWHLVTASWDTDQAVAGQDVRCRVKEVRGNGIQDSRVGWPDKYTQYVTPPPASLTPAATFTLGPWLCDKGIPFDMNHVIDELAVYDFGDDALAAQAPLDAMQIERGWDGRYYKGGDAAFVSTVLKPSGGERVNVLGADWTAYTPAENRQELLAPSFDVDAMPLPEKGQPRRIDPALVDALGKARVSVAVDLLAMNPASGTWEAVRTLENGRWDGLVLPSFRYRVRFPTELADPRDDPILETPFLDDITFYYRKQGGPRILSVERP